MSPVGPNPNLPYATLHYRTHAHQSRHGVNAAVSAVAAAVVVCVWLV